MCLNACMYIFFFQAEDGIRDVAVTGVQTCALPISTLFVVLLLALTPGLAFAAPTGGGAPMPWTGPLQSLLANLTGPTARILAALASVAVGPMWALSRHEEVAKLIAPAIVGTAVTIGAPNVVKTLASA